MESNSKERKLLLAIQAIQENENLPVSHAAKIHTVPESTLRARTKGRPSRRDITPNSRKLTDLEEEAIVEHILDPDSRGFPPRLVDVEDMANLLLAERGTEKVGKLWARNFVKRQPQLQTRVNRLYNYQRAFCEDPQQDSGLVRACAEREGQVRHR
jgi:hypothetical protein